MKEEIQSQNDSCVRSASGWAPWEYLFFLVIAFGFLVLPWVLISLTAQLNVDMDEFEAQNRSKMTMISASPYGKVVSTELVDGVWGGRNSRISTDSGALVCKGLASAAIGRKVELHTFQTRGLLPIEVRYALFQEGDAVDSCEATLVLNPAKRHSFLHFLASGSILNTSGHGPGAAR